MEQEIISPLSVREKFDSLIEYATVARERDQLSGRRHSSARDGRAKDFNGWTNFSQALKMAETGWEAQAQQALNLAEQSIQKLREERIIPQPTMLWDVSGAEVDIARYLGNEPENMLEFPPMERLGTGEIVTIVRSFAVNGSVNSEDIEKYGRLIAALVLSLEQMGIPTEVWAEGVIGVHCDYGSGRIYQRIKIKGAADYLHTGQLMFAMAHPAMLRQVGFASYQNSKGYPPAIYKATSPGSGYGFQTPRNAEETALWPAGTLFFDANHWNDDPVVFLVKQLMKLNLVPQR